MNITSEDRYDHSNNIELDAKELAVYCGVAYAPLPTTATGHDLPMLIHGFTGGDPFPIIAESVKKDGVTAIHRAYVHRIYDGNHQFRFTIFMRVFK